MHGKTLALKRSAGCRDPLRMSMFVHVFHGLARVRHRIEITWIGCRAERAAILPHVTGVASTGKAPGQGKRDPLFRTGRTTMHGAGLLRPIDLGRGVVQLRGLQGVDRTNPPHPGECTHGAQCGRRHSNSDGIAHVSDPCKFYRAQAFQRVPNVLLLTIHSRTFSCRFARVVGGGRC